MPKRKSRLKSNKYAWENRWLVYPLVGTAVLILGLNFLRQDKQTIVAIVQADNVENGYIAVSDGGGLKPSKNVLLDHASGEKLSISDITAAKNRIQGGFWAVSESGEVAAYGGAPYHGGIDGNLGNPKIVDLIPDPKGEGYRLVDELANVYDFNVKSLDLGSSSAPDVGKDNASKIVSGISTPSGKGYWLVSLQGEVYAFGDATKEGDLSGKNLDIVTIAPTQNGYVLITSDNQYYGFPEGESLACTNNKNLSEVKITAFGSSPDGSKCWYATKSGDISEL